MSLTEMLVAMTGFLLCFQSWLLVQAASLLEDAELLAGGISFKEHGVVIRYASNAVDSHAKALEKARELEVMHGVKKAAALECLGSIMVSCTSGDARKHLVTNLIADPAVEVMLNSGAELPQCRRSGGTGIGSLSSNASDTDLPAPLRIWNHSSIAAGTQADLGSSKQAGDKARMKLERSDTAEDAEIAYEVDPVFEAVTLQGLSAPLAAKHRLVIAQAIAANLPKVGLQVDDIRILRVSNARLQPRSPIHGKQHPAFRKPSSAMMVAAQVDFEVAPPSTASNETMDQIEAWLLLLRESGRATEHFNAALLMALRAEGLSMPRGMHAIFGTPHQGLVSGEAEAGMRSGDRAGNAVKVRRNGTRHTLLEPDNESFLMVVLVFVFLFVGIAVVVSLFVSMGDL